jgi:lysozyme
MTISQNGIDFIKQQEGLSLTAYRDSAGWSIGYGHFGAKQGDKITKAQAETYLKQDLKTAVDTVNSVVKVALTQSQFNAICSFIYNVGVTAFKTSTLLKVLNTGDITLAAKEFSKWIHDNVGVNTVLVKRRNAEASLFLSEVIETSKKGGKVIIGVLFLFGVYKLIF